jgi:hypothetical protein
MTDGPEGSPADGRRPGDSAGPLRYPMPVRRQRGKYGQPPRYVILTPTAREARDADIALRQRRYLKVMIPCLLLVLFGFFCYPAPAELRLVALGIGAFLPPIAAMVANT